VLKPLYQLLIVCTNCAPIAPVFGAAFLRIAGEPLQCKGISGQPPVSTPYFLLLRLKSTLGEIRHRGQGDYMEII
jgi:hypothetical protein